MRGPKRDAPDESRSRRGGVGRWGRSVARSAGRPRPCGKAVFVQVGSAAGLGGRRKRSRTTWRL